MFEIICVFLTNQTHVFVFFSPSIRRILLKKWTHLSCHRLSVLHSARHQRWSIPTISIMTPFAMPGNFSIPLNIKFHMTLMHILIVPSPISVFEVVQEQCRIWLSCCRQPEAQSLIHCTTVNKYLHQLPWHTSKSAFPALSIPCKQLWGEIPLFTQGSVQKP